MLTVDVNRRVDVNQFMASPWIAEISAVPSTPLVTSKNMMEQQQQDPDCLRATQQEMESYMSTMRVNNNTTIKDVKKSNNKLIERRKKKASQGGAGDAKLSLGIPGTNSEINTSSNQTTQVQ